MLARQFECAERSGDVACDLLQKADVVIEHLADHRGIEQIVRVDERDFESMRTFARFEHEIEARRLRDHFMIRNIESRQLQRVAIRAEIVEHRLKQRRMAEAALRLQGLDELRERQIRVILRFEHALAHARQQLREARHAGERRADHQRVDEEADDARRFRAIASRDRHADADIVLAAVTREQEIVGREQCHERRGIGRKRHACERGLQRGRYHPREPRARAAAHAGACANAAVRAPDDRGRAVRANSRADARGCLRRTTRAAIAHSRRIAAVRGRRLLDAHRVRAHRMLRDRPRPAPPPTPRSTSRPRRCDGPRYAASGRPVRARSARRAAAGRFRDRTAAPNDGPAWRRDCRRCRDRTLPSRTRTDRCAETARHRPRRIAGADSHGSRRRAPAHDATPPCRACRAIAPRRSRCTPRSMDPDATGTTNAPARATTESAGRDRDSARSADAPRRCRPSSAVRETLRACPAAGQRRRSKWTTVLSTLRGRSRS